jgi:hypothetical protein
MVNFQGKNWYLTVTRNISLFTSTLDVVGHYFYSRKYDLIPRESLIIVKNGRQASVFINKENIFKYHQQLEKVCLSPKRLRKIEAAYYKFGNNLLKASNLLEKNLTRQSFQNFIKAYSYLAAGLYLTIGIGRHMSELLVTKLKKIYPTISQKDLDILISEITYSPKFTPLTKSQLSLLEIGAELQKEKIEPQEIMTQPKIYKKFKDHIKKYSAIPVNFTEEPWTEKEILDQLKNLMKTDCQKEKENILKQHEMKIKKSKEVLAKIKNKEIKNIVNSLKVGTFLNEYRKYIFCQANLAYRPLFQKIAERYKLSNWRECFKFTPHEIINLYFNQKLQILNILPERNLAGIVFAKNKNGYRLLSKKEITLFLPEIKKITSKEEITEVQEIYQNPNSAK